MVLLTMHKSRMVVCIQSGFIGVTVFLLVLFRKAYSNECPENYCGKNCTDICSCKSPLDSQQKANFQRCNGSCLDGWQGERCDIRKCKPEYFGFGCRYQCHCIKQCDPWTGKCFGADRRCKLDFYGPSCQKRKSSQVCPAGIFGPDCEYTCYCFNMTSCSNNGSCPGDGKCEIGWQGKACNSKCSPGSFGEDCRRTCHCSNDQPCDHVTGKCPHGCSDGWLNDMCNKQCSSGYFGKGCKYGCGNCLGGPGCDPVNGTCFSGCINGWRGPRCRHKDKDDTGSETSNEPDHKYTLGPNRDLDGGSVGPTQTENNCTENELEAGKEASSFPVGAATGGGIGVGVVIILILIMISLWKKRFNRKKDEICEAMNGLGQSRIGSMPQENLNHLAEQNPSYERLNIVMNPDLGRSAENVYDELDVINKSHKIYSKIQVDTESQTAPSKNEQRFNEGQYFYGQTLQQEETSNECRITSPTVVY